VAAFCEGCRLIICVERFQHSLVDIQSISIQSLYEIQNYSALTISRCLSMAARGQNAKKRAVVAVARKLAVLLHRLWVSGEVYEPLRNSQKVIRAAA